MANQWFVGVFLPSLFESKATSISRKQLDICERYMNPVSDAHQNRVGGMFYTGHLETEWNGRHVTVHYRRGKGGSAYGEIHFGQTSSERNRWMLEEIQKQMERERRGIARKMGRGQITMQDILNRIEDVTEELADFVAENGNIPADSCKSQSDYENYQYIYECGQRLAMLNSFC